MIERLHTTMDGLTRAEIQAAADKVIKQCEIEGRRVPQILYRWGELAPDERDRERALERLAETRKR